MDSRCDVDNPNLESLSIGGGVFFKSKYISLHSEYSSNAKRIDLPRLISIDNSFHNARHLVFSSRR